MLIEIVLKLGAECWSETLLLNELVRLVEPAGRELGLNCCTCFGRLRKYSTNVFVYMDFYRVERVARRAPSAAYDTLPVDKSARTSVAAAKRNTVVCT